MPRKPSQELVRVVFDLEPSWHGSLTERLWAEPVGRNRYRLQNSPFYAFGVSAEDVVFGEEREDGFHYKGTSLAGGHSTYRLRIARDATKAAFAQYWAPLEKLGCTYEEGDLVFAVDVPPRANIYEAYALLEAGETAGVWSFQEGHCGHPLDASRTRPTTDST